MGLRSFAIGIARRHEVWRMIHLVLVRRPQSVPLAEVVAVRIQTKKIVASGVDLQN